MISKATTEKLTALIVAIDRAGLKELVEGYFAYQALKLILETGSDLPAHVERTAEQVEMSADAYSMVNFWGIKDPRWVDFCIEWYESTFMKARGKTR